LGAVVGLRKLFVVGAAFLFIAVPIMWLSAPIVTQYASATRAQNRDPAALDALQRLIRRDRRYLSHETLLKDEGLKIDVRQFDAYIAYLLQDQGFVCNRLVTFEPRGQFARGYFAKVKCRGDGSNLFTYRFDAGPDFERYQVRVWSPHLDD
jgi:hypothetical protein